MDKGPGHLGEPSSRHDPYRSWATGILVELGAFALFGLALFALMAAVVLLVSLVSG